MPKDIVILHGWGRGAKSYEEAKRLLEQRGNSVYLFDLPGFGEAPPPENPWSVDDYADFVWKFLQANNLNEIFLWGNSFGGRIAIKLAVSHPEKLRGLILCAAAGIKHELVFRQKIARLLARAGKPASRLLGVEKFAEFAKRIIYKIGGSHDYRLATGVMKETMKKADSENSEDLRPYLSKIQVPTLIVWGKKDNILPLTDAYVMNKEITGSQLKILEDVGHRPHKESPEKLAEIIDNFINQQLKTNN